MIVTAPTPEVPVIAYHVTEELEVQGEPLTLEANDATVWRRRVGASARALDASSRAAGDSTAIAPRRSSA